MNNKINKAIKIIIFLVLSILIILLSKRFYLFSLSASDYIKETDKNSVENLLYEEKLDDIAVVFYTNKDEEYLLTVLKVNRTGYKTLGTSKNDLKDFTFSTYDYKGKTYSISWKISSDYNVHEVYFDELKGNITDINDSNIRIFWSISSAPKAPLITLN